MAKDLKPALCACHSKKPYRQCCQPFHKGLQHPETPLLLMRSRYAAYALGLAGYIMDTTHPLHSGFQQDRKSWQRSLEDFSRNTQFLDLEILDFDEETVTFRAVLSQEGQDATFVEKSAFVKVNDRWLYLNPL